MSTLPLLLPLPRILYRVTPIIKPHINTLRHRDTATPHGTPRPQSHELPIPRKAQPQRQRHRNDIVDEQVAPTADTLLAQTPQQRIHERGAGICELKHSKKRKHSGDDTHDFRVRTKSLGQYVAETGQEGKVEEADDEEG